MSSDNMSNRTGNSVKIRVTVLCARNLAKRDLFRLPDPFVRVVVENAAGAGQNHSTESCKNTLDPKWNQVFRPVFSEVKCNKDWEV